MTVGGVTGWSLGLEECVWRSWVLFDLPGVRVRAVLTFVCSAARVWVSLRRRDEGPWAKGTLSGGVWRHMGTSTPKAAG